MTTFLQPAGPLKKLQGPGQSSSSERSETYDYSGLEDHIKRQDAVEALKGQKFAAYYAGDIPAAVEAGSKIRTLVAGLRRLAPGTTESNPNQVSMPHAVVRSSSVSGSNRSEGPMVEFAGALDEPPAPGAPKKKNV